MKFLVPNYSCLQNPWLRGYSPQISVLCPQLNLLNPPWKKFLGMPLTIIILHDFYYCLFISCCFYKLPKENNINWEEIKGPNTGIEEPNEMKIWKELRWLLWNKHFQFITHCFILFNHINFKPFHVTIMLIPPPQQNMERGPRVWAVEPGEKKDNPKRTWVATL